ncbi:MAG TPA: transporter [Thermodesulfobacteriota bacterium]|nr:transporter [Thermodesulfobacteriota bacterium]
MNRSYILLLTITLIGFSVSDTSAIDHSNLDEGRPLRVEDPYPIAHGELAVEAGLGFSVERRRDDRFFSPIEILYGAYPNLQIGIGTSFSSESDNEQAKFGDIELEALYNFNQETLSLPAFGVKLEFNIPTGVDSPGTGLKVKGLTTKSFGHLSMHTNAAYQYLNGDRDGEKDNRLEFILGASYPIGAPQYTRLTAIGNVFTDLSVEEDDSSVVGTEFGFRYQLTQRAVLDAGVGSEFAGASERSSFFATTGISFSF